MQPAGALPTAAELHHALRDATPREVIATALKIVGRERLAVVGETMQVNPTLLHVLKVDFGCEFDHAAQKRSRYCGQCGPAGGG